MKFNVHKWDGKNWNYVATVDAADEQTAAKAVASKFGMTGRFASYPHIDTIIGQATSKSVFTDIG